MSVEKGAALYNRRYERGAAAKPPTRAEVAASGIARGAARWAALHATAPVTGPDGTIVQRPDLEARAAARALLSAEDQAEVDNLAGRASYDS